MTQCTFNPATREGEHATLVEHNAVVGTAIHGEPVHFDRAQPVRRFKIDHRVTTAGHRTMPGYSAC
jgi:hypothetical protein